MLNLRRIYNETYGEEMALINDDTKEVLVKGDYYHDKIYEKIEGFLEGLKFAGVNFKLEENITVGPSNELFKICDFYDGSDD